MKSIDITLIEDKVKEIKNQILCALQKEWDVNIKDCINGREALDYLNSPQAPVDLILLDLKIPFEKFDAAKRENGEKVLRSISRIENNRIIPTIIITAYPDLLDEPVSFGRRYKIYCYIDKTNSEFSEKLYSCVHEIIHGEIKNRNRFCSFGNKVCSRPVRFKGRNSCFLAYSSEGRYAGFMKDLKKELKAEGIDAFDWLDKDRDFDSPSGLVFCPFLCDRIFSRNVFVANITDKNSNVYFEWGFSIAIGRKSYALCQEDSAESLPSLLRNNLHIPYKDTDVKEKFFFDDYLNNLYGRLTDILPALYTPPNPASNVLGIFPNDKTHKSYIANKLSEFIKNLELLCLERENNIITVLNRILSAEKIVLDLLSDKEDAALDNNATLLFLAGFALGCGKKIFLLQQEPIQKSIADVYPILQPYNDINEVESKLKEWESMV
jgi:CheY-like chemotaxis protein